ncbi:MAG: ATP-binding protein [Cytophagia bacterium]|nr:ATP-binding protein [Cytophagia bacterium]
MTLKELQVLSRKGEGQTLEFKKKANHPEKIVKELVAFANTHGGQLLLGVDDNGEPSGTRDIEGEAFLLEKAIQELIRPKLNYSLEYLHLTDKKGIAIFKVDESQRKPHFVKENPTTRRGTAYVRYRDESIQASREIREIIQRRLKNKDIQFTYGEKEKALLEYLDQHNKITLEEFASAVSISKFKASRTLIRLVLANVLEVNPSAKGDFFTLKTQ